MVSPLKPVKTSGPDGISPQASQNQWSKWYLPSSPQGTSRGDLRYHDHHLLLLHQLRQGSSQLEGGTSQPSVQERWTLQPGKLPPNLTDLYSLQDHETYPCKPHHILVSHIMDHMEPNRILCDQQHGFRTQRSCDSASPSFWKLLMTSHQTLIDWLIDCF